MTTLLTKLQAANAAYRAGYPSMSDHEYDALLAQLPEDHPYRNAVEPEPSEKTTRLPERMLSTQKAYTLKEIEKWADSVIEAGRKLDIYDIFFRVTPKLDGFAAYYDGTTLYTRGDGRSGTDISHTIARGLTIDTRGPGEIVVDKGYFQDCLADHYENSRNIIAGVIKEGNLDEDIKSALEADAVCFVAFDNLKGWLRNKPDLLTNLEDIWESNARTCAFDTDGLVIEAVNVHIKEAMGATNHHHRWQIAYKKNEEYHNIRVTNVLWQTSQNGRLTPVVQLEPTRISGATVSKATGHHYGNIVDNRIDTGATVRVCRSGLVIPYIERTIEPAYHVHIPSQCPSCGAPTEVDGDNLLCSNTETCPAQIEGRIEHFFKTIGNCDGFGPKMIEQLANSGVKSVARVYDMTVTDFGKVIGGATGDNLFSELTASKNRPIEDWRFLAAFSMKGMGKGMCEKLLKHHALADIFDLTAEQATLIEGFAEKTAYNLITSLTRILPEYDALQGFNLIETSREQTLGVLSGKTIVFTGTLSTPRATMEGRAKALGAKVSSSVTSKTDYLVCGENVGAAKTNAAAKHGVTILTEEEYLCLIISV